MPEWRWSVNPDGSYYAFRAHHKDSARAHNFRGLFIKIDMKMDGDAFNLIEVHDRPNEATDG